MKTITSFFILAAVTLLLTNQSAFSQVTPTTPDVNLFCDGTDLVLPTPATGTQYIVRYSEMPTTTPSNTLTLDDDGVTIPSSELATGYYYVSIEGDATNPELCESDMTELPVYKFAPLTVAFTAKDYCIEDASNQSFIGTVTSTDSYDTYTYQWYTVANDIETEIEGATTETYKPSTDVAAGTTTTYRLKAGYRVGELRYCAAISDVEVTVTAKPTAPTITIEGSTGETL